MSKKISIFNIIHKDEYIFSVTDPNFLPDKDYSLIEIIIPLRNNEGDEEKIDFNKIIVKGLHYMENSVEKYKESILDLDLSYLETSLQTYLNREDIDKDKIFLNFMEDIKRDDIYYKIIFICLVASYLTFFNFMDLPFYVNTELLCKEMISYFIDIPKLTSEEKSMTIQSSLLYRYFSPIFPLKYKYRIDSAIISKESDIIKDINAIQKEIDMQKKDSDTSLLLTMMRKVIYRVEGEIDTFYKDVKIYKRKLFRDLNLKK